MTLRHLQMVVFIAAILWHFSTCLGKGPTEIKENSKCLNDERKFTHSLPKTLDKDNKGYLFSDVNQLSSHDGLPDLFAKPDGSRVLTIGFLIWH